MLQDRAVRTSPVCIQLLGPTGFHLLAAWDGPKSTREQMEQGLAVLARGVQLENVDGFVLKNEQS